MTPEEKLIVSTRLAKANDLESRMSRLHDAVKQLAGGGITGIFIPLDNSQRLMYRTGTDKPQGFYDICWSRDEPTLGTDMREYLDEIIKHRLEELEKEYESL